MIVIDGDTQVVRVLYIDHAYQLEDFCDSRGFKFAILKMYKIKYG